jgi:hypothetical protein
MLLALGLEAELKPQAPARFVRFAPCAECGSAMLREPFPTSAFLATTEHQARNSQ